MSRTGRPRRVTELQHLMLYVFWRRGFEAHSKPPTIARLAEITGLTTNQINYLAAREPHNFPPRNKRKEKEVEK